MARQYFQGMGEAVAARTVNRPGEGWSDVARRVALGSTLIADPEDRGVLQQHLENATILMSGRHLQHGDETQPQRNLEVFSNCSTAAQRSLVFYLLLNGSGVGSSYDDAICNVDFRNMPKVVCTIDPSHADVLSGKIVGFRSKAEVIEELWEVGLPYRTFNVPDSREGWAYAIEEIETMSWQGTYRDYTLIIDFSEVRPHGSPIGGMQDRPASGPGPLMEAIVRVAKVRDQADWKPWRQAMQIDHELAECVLVGGARRSARIAIKNWRDPDIMEFINVKQDGGLWTANNSVGVDDDFWSEGKEIMDAVLEAQYTHGTGEPGFLNLRVLRDGEDRPTIHDAMHLGGKYKLSHQGSKLREELFHIADKMNFPYITNPCVTADTWVQTTDGPRQVEDLIGVPFNALVDGKPYPATGFWSTGIKPVYDIKTARGYSVRVTANHKMLTTEGWVEAGNLVPGSQLVLQRQNAQKSDLAEFKHGWAIGHVMGDGSYNPALYATVMNFWPQDSDELVELAEEIGGKRHSGTKVRRVQTRAFDDMLDGYLTPLKKEPTKQLEQSNASLVAGFLAGIFDSDGSVEGSVVKGRSIRLTQTNLTSLHAIQRMLARFGILSTIYTDRTPERMRDMPGGTYLCKATHTLMISRENMRLFYEKIGFMDPDKREKIEALFDSEKRRPYRDNGVTEVVSVEHVGNEEVYDCTVEAIHRFDANGLTAHNCGEIRLHVLGAYCTIADVVPFHAETDEEAVDAFILATRALLRTNMLPALYQGEVDRTNRIGVGFTGIHEYAWKRFGYTFLDLLDEEKSAPFWDMISDFSRAVEIAAEEWCAEHGREVPHTMRTVKPAGTTSKLFGLTEGVHLPAMREFLRWVQFRSDDPLVAEYAQKGYPIRDLKTYGGTTIVGFPTQPVICQMGVDVVTAAEATPEQQFQWLRLLEKYWLGYTRGNQISYTLKYDPKVVGLEDYKRIMIENVPTVRAVSVMPQIDATAYEYQPEEPISSDVYKQLVDTLERIKEDVGLEHVDCASGACPIDFKTAAA